MFQSLTYVLSGLLNNKNKLFTDELEHWKLKFECMLSFHFDFWLFACLIFQKRHGYDFIYDFYGMEFDKRL